MQERSKQECPRSQTGPAGSLQLALAKFGELQLTVQQVRRVAVERNGGIHLEVHTSDGQRFFIYEADELRELFSESDRKIPFLVNRSQADFAAEHTIISYRPGRRVVLGPGNDGPETIIKAYKKRRSEQAAKNHAIALAACEQGGFEVPGLLQYRADCDCLIMAKRSGEPPGVSLDATGTWGLIGTCLRRFQQATITNDLQVFTYRDELAVLDERARRLLLCMPALPQHWQAGRERLEEAAKTLLPAVNGLAHRDLHDGQLIVANQTISLLDFDLACRADVALDAGNLLAHLRLRALQQRQADGDAVAACSKAFLIGFGRQHEPQFDQHLLFYQATTFYRLALLYVLRPRWAHLSDTLLVEGNRCIDMLDGLRDGS
jgi:hypothetical protein